MLEELQEKYLDEIRALLPLHRIFLCMLGFMSSLIISNQTHKSITESLIRLNLTSLSFETGKLFENAQIWHVLIGILLTIFTFLLNNNISKIILKFLLSKTNAKNKIEEKTLKIRELLQKENHHSKEILPLIEKQSEEAKNKISRIANNGELCTGIFICFGIASWYGNIIDISMSIIFLVTALMKIYFAIYYFFSKYLKYDIVKAILSNEQSELKLPTD